MDVKQFFQRIGNYIKTAWEQGKIQRTSRITYDVIWNMVLFFLVVGAVVVVFAGGVGAGYFASLVKDEPIRSYEDMRNDIYNYEETSKLYFADEKYIGNIRSDLHREEVKLENVSDILIKAVIATEDEMFYEHDGVVPKAIVRALYQEATNSDTKTGGSTLTQQLIKNQILTNEVSFERKAKEILLAMRLENFFEKDEILEAYLNIIPYGREASGANIAGIQTAAKGVFGVEPNELTLPQAAFLAGMPQNPFAYTPFTNQGEIKDEEALKLGLNRMKTVLKRMYHAEFITEKEYQEALEYDIVGDFTEKSISPLEKYPSVVFELERRAKEILKQIIVEEDGYTLEEVNKDEDLKEQYNEKADRALRMNGYHIHSTINQKMYDTMQKVTADYAYFGPDRTFTPKGADDEITEQVEVGSVLIENNTGKILSFVPGRSDSLNNQNNHATGAGASGRPAGSTFKPLAVYAPAMELGAVQPGSVFADIPGLPGYSPDNYGGAYYGLVSAREALQNSYNVTTAEIYKDILYANPGKEFVMKMGIPLSAEDQENPSIALGPNNVTVEQNTNAFATFSNSGKYIPSYMIEKITDSDGNVIYEHEAEPVEVFSPQTAYLTIDMMRDVVRSGTGAYVPGRLAFGGVDWAGKTGTSNDYEDAWFVGTNPNVTMGVWLGYDTPYPINYCSDCGGLSYSQRTQNLWAQLMNAVTEIDQELMAPQQAHKQPDGLVTRSYCASSGMAPSEICSQAGLVRSDIYNAKYVPTKTDDSLVGGNMPLVMVDGEQVIAHENTPSEFTTSEKGGFAFNPEFLKRKGYDRLSDLSMLIPRKNPEPWKKISFKGSSVTASSSIDADANSKPAAPGPLNTNKRNVSWEALTGQLVVGYRIYYAKEKGGSEKLIGHTVDPSYSLPDTEGHYLVRAVNYFGQESDSSSHVIIKPEKKKEDKSEKKKEKEEKEKKKEDKDNNKGKKPKKEKEKPEEESDEE